MDKPRAGCGVTTQAAVLELPVLERTLLWSIRTWAAYHDAPQSVWWPLERAFTEAGIRPALEPFAQLMCALFAGLKQCPDIRCVRCLRIGKDEKQLLAILANALQESPRDLELHMRRLMAPAAARVAAAAAVEMMGVIVNAGLQLDRAFNDTQMRWPPDYQLESSAPIGQPDHTWH